MLITKCLPCIVISSKWRFWGKRKLTLKHANGTVALTVKTRGASPMIWDRISLVDASGMPWLASGNRARRRLYADFETLNVTGETNSVLINAKEMCPTMFDDPNFECLSFIVQEYYTEADDHDLALMVIQTGAIPVNYRDFNIRV